MALVLAPEWVAVKIEKQEEKKTATGILMYSDTAEEIEKLREGEVLEVGYEAKQLLYRKGDKILFSKYATTEYKDEVHVLNYNDIIAKIIP